jgi:putative flavoprotein involved in K+ transport
MADLKLGRLLDTVDNWARTQGVDRHVESRGRFAETHVDDSPPLNLSLTSGEVRTVVWATGFRPDYAWLEAPVFDRKGRLRHDGGVVEAPGMYVRRRKSSFIHGAEDDARELSGHLATYLDRSSGRSVTSVAGLARS